MNKELTHDCGNPKDGYLKIGVAKSFPEKHPDAYKVLQKINFSDLDIAVMAKLVDVDKMETEDAASKWLAENEDRWKSWLQ